MNFNTNFNYKALTIICLLNIFCGEASRAKQIKSRAINLRNRSFKNSKHFTSFDTVANDPVKMRIYTLSNGLTIYLSVNKGAPQIQTYIVTKGGSKNDPADATGLAHYLEHLLFKGTDKYGTLDYSKEKPLLDKIEELYESYRNTTNPGLRKKIYQQIDSASGAAAKFAIANEYDKVIAGIGGTGSNAFTSYDVTAYTVEIPSNQFSNWLNLEAERFRNPVLRIFHTELEAVYEEKNISLSEDREKVSDLLMAELFKNNTYGTQTTIGTVEHLKNPSIKKIKQFYNEYYVPNNMAIILCGDFDPDSTYNLIAQKFSYMKPKTVAPYIVKPEATITKPVIKEVLGPEAESVTIAFRAGGSNSDEELMLQLFNEMLYNRVAGLLDINVNQAQKVLDPYSYIIDLSEFTVQMLGGSPREGQKLEEVKDILLNEIENIKKGNYPDWLISACINNIKLRQIKDFEDNDSRAGKVLESFIHNTKWPDYLKRIDRISAFTKERLMRFANAVYSQNCVIVYKRTGHDPNVVKVDKPQITPVELNREKKSPFLQQVLGTKVKDIHPRFINFGSDLKTFICNNNIPLVYTPNTDNELFTLKLHYSNTEYNNPRYILLPRIIDVLGAGNYTASQFKQELFKHGSRINFDLNPTGLEITIEGLTNYFNETLQLAKLLLDNPKVDDKAIAEVKQSFFKELEDAKLNKEYILREGLNNYARYGDAYSKFNADAYQVIKSTTTKEVVELINLLGKSEHKLFYCGSIGGTEVVASINKYHTVHPFQPLAALKTLDPVDVKQSKVYMVHFPEMQQAEIMFIARSENYNPSNIPSVTLYNEYFGGGMASVVFQTLRESKALAYSTKGKYELPVFKNSPFFMTTFIGTQSDKLGDAMQGMKELIIDLPVSNTIFESSKTSILQHIRSQRIRKVELLDYYISNESLGNTEDLRQAIFNFVSKAGLEDLSAFQTAFIKNDIYTVVIVGDKDRIKSEVIKKYGELKILTFKDIFGY